MKVKAYLEITMKILEKNRPAAAKVFNDYREIFLKNVKGALTKELLIRDEDVQVLHGFDSLENAKNYLETELFQKDVVGGLKPTWESEPEIKFYSVA